MATTKNPTHRLPAFVALVCAFFSVNALNAAPALQESQCDGTFMRGTVSVTTQLLVGTESSPSYRIIWKLPAQPPLGTLVRPPPNDYQIGFSFKTWQGYVDQKNETARLSTPAGMEEVKLDCRRRPYARPQKRR